MNLCPRCHIIYYGHGCPMCGRGKRREKPPEKPDKKRKDKGKKKTHRGSPSAFFIGGQVARLCAVAR